MGTNHLDDDINNESGINNNSEMTMMEIPPPLVSSSNDHVSITQALTEMERNILLTKGKKMFSEMFHFVRFAQKSSTKYATKISSSSMDIYNITSSEKKKTTTFNSTMLTSFSIQVMGSLEEIAGLFIDDITHDNIDTTSRNKMIFDFDKHKKIYQLLSPTKEKPFLAASLKWSLWQTPSKLLLNDRDFCCLEYMDEFIDDHGRRGWARAVKSIEHPSCPPPPLKTTTPSSSNGPIRGEVNCLAIVAKENNAIHGIVDVQMVLQMDTHGIPSKLAQVFIKSKIKNMLNLNHILMISRKQQQQHSLLSSSVLLSSTLSGSYREIPDECTTSYHSFSSMAPAALSSSSKDKNNKKKCSCCRFHISRWSKTRRCRVCNEILCKKCYTLSYSVADSRCDRLCYSCAHKIRSYNANEIPLLESNRSVIFSHYDDAEEEEDAQEIDKSSVFLLNDSIDDTMSVYSMANSDHYGLMNRNTSSTSISPKERVASSFVAPHTTPVGARSTMMNQNKPTQFNNGYDHTRSKKCDLSYLKNILPASSIRSTKYDK